MAEIRTFVAIAIPDSIREQISQVQATLKEFHAPIKWVEAENIHLTLKFLGNTKEELIDPIAQALSEAATSVDPIEIHVQGVGAFPNLKYPRILWVGTQVQNEDLSRLARNIDQKLATFGFEREKRPFSAHLTIGRIRDRKGTNPVIEKLKEYERFDAGSFMVNEIILFKSQLTKTGPIYSVLKKVPLKQ